MSVDDSAKPPQDPLDEVLASWSEAMPGTDLTTIILSISTSRLAALFNRGIDELVRPYGFGYGELEVLFYLLSSKKPYEMRPSNLTRGCFVTSGAITGRVDRLVKLGFVTRIPSLVDRREMVVRLTRNGEKIARRLREITAADSALAVALRELPEETRTTLGANMRQLLRRVEELVSDGAESSRPVPAARRVAGR